MVRESIHEKLKRVHPPRVHITYEVETGGAKETKALPFVMGVLGDFSGDSSKELPKLKQRRFVEVNPDTFDHVLRDANPRLSLTVPNKLTSDPNKAQLNVNLTFERLEDFEPEQVASKVKPLRELLQLRNRLADLRGDIQVSDTLDELLLEVVNNTKKLERYRAERGQHKGPEGGSNE